jgi:hypothetical protein
VDVVTYPPSRRTWVSSDGAIVYCAAIIGLVVAAVLKVKLGQWNEAGVRACVSTGTAAAYCRNTEPYPTVLQCAYALIAGWTTFFAAWFAFTMQPRILR